MKVLDGPMNVQLEDGDLRRLCEMAVVGARAGFGLPADRQLLYEVCYHMVWDDLTDLLDRPAPVGIVGRYRRWHARFGARGIPGWFMGQWHRLVGFRPDWRPWPQDRNWAPPKSASPSRREWWERLTSGMAKPEAWRACPDLAGMTDEELAERMKTAKLGEGVIAEWGARQHRQQQHVCQLPPLDFLEFGTTWDCPECHKRWAKTIDEADSEGCAYWDPEEA